MLVPRPWMRSKHVAWLLLVFVPLVPVLMFGQEPGTTRAASLMRMKLTPTKEILEGIALGDFEMISKNAGLVRNLLLDENWMVVQSDEYRRQTEEFRRQVDNLRDAARAKSMEGVTLAYVQMTLRCVECHKTLRPR